MEKIDANEVAGLATSLYLYAVEGDYAALGRKVKRIDQRMTAEEAIKALKQAEEEVNKPGVRKLICPALLSTADDIMTLSVALTASISSLALTGQINVPLSAAFVAGVVVLVYRAGVKSFCQNIK